MVFASGAEDAAAGRAATVTGWLPERGGFDRHDVAVLRLSQQLPEGVGPLLLVGGDPTGQVQMWGPSTQRSTPGHVTGQLMGEVEDGRWQIDQHLRGVFRVQPGFSGGPVWRARTGEVVGILQAAATGEDATDAYVIGVDVIARAWPAGTSAPAGLHQRAQPAPDPAGVTALHLGDTLSVPGHVFISYRHGDEVPYVQRLADHLTNEGVSVWFDREIVTGDRWDRVIRSKIDTCAALVVLMTPQAEESDWVAREIDQAELMHKPIFPLLLDGRRFFRLANLQYEDVTGARMPRPSFVARLRAISAGEPPSAAATDTPSTAAEPVAEPPSSPLLVARPVITIPTSRAVGAAIAVSPDGASLAVAPGGARCSGGNAVHVYDTTTWRERFAVSQHWSSDQRASMRWRSAPTERF